MILLRVLGRGMTISHSIKPNSIYDILIVAANANDADLVQKMFSKHKSASFKLTVAKSVAEGGKTLGSKKFSAILLNLKLPDSQGMDTFQHFYKIAPQIPIIIFNGPDDEELAIQAIKEGAQDYLIKEKLESKSLICAIERAIERKIIQESFLLGEMQYNKLVELSPNGVAILEDTAILFVNSAFANMVGIANKATLMNESILVYVHPNYREYVISWLDRIRILNENSRIELILNKADGTYINVEMTATPIKYLPKTAIQIIVNRVAECVQNKPELEHLLQYDTLTGLVNRRLLEDRIKQGLVDAEKNKTHLVVFHINLDHFKLINEIYGHKMGDLLLQAVAHSLKEETRTVDTVARLAGDEFVVVSPDVENINSISKLAERFSDLISQPFIINNQEMFTTGSIGISFFPENGADSQTLLKNADLALHYAKLQGRNNYQFFVPKLILSVRENKNLIYHLIRALREDEFLLYYQPVVDWKSGKIVALEALIRWNKEKKEIIMPANFIFLAEETNLIFQIGEWLIRTACHQNLVWKKNGINPIRIAINLSPRQLHLRARLMETITNILTETELPAECLELEIKENVTMLDLHIGESLLRTFKDMGIALTVDDYGASYISLSELKRYNITALKIDRSLISQLPNNENSAAIVSNIIDVATKTDIGVIAEGVEKKEQLDFLIKHGCDLVQGFYFSPPLPPEKLIPYLNGTKRILKS